MSTLHHIPTLPFARYSSFKAEHVSTTWLGVSVGHDHNQKVSNTAIELDSLQRITESELPKHFDNIRWRHIIFEDRNSRNESASALSLHCHPSVHQMRTRKLKHPSSGVHRETNGTPAQPRRFTRV